MVGGKTEGLRKLKEAGAKTQAQTTEEESKLLVVSIPVDLKLYPNCGEPRKAAAKEERSSRLNSDVQRLEESEGVDLRYGNILNLNQIPKAL